MRCRVSKEVKLTKNDLVLGQELPWDVYDSSDKLLLCKDSIIASETQLSALLNRGMYRNLTDAEKEKQKPLEDNRTPFDIVYDFAGRLSQIFSSINLGQDTVEARTRKLCKELQQLCNRDSDAALGAVHLCFDYPYSVMHSIDVAILCELVAKRLGWDDERRSSLISAALTCNVAMQKLQDQLQSQETPLTDQQREAINIHPQQSFEMLKNCGINDSVWLEAVVQHHERIDGSGYPKGIKGNDLAIEAALIAVLDRYTAMISGRTYRDGIHAKEVLSKMFVDRGQVYDESICITLIKELGIYPPGAFVRLVNGEIGIVIKRGKDSMKPIVSCFISPRGGLYTRPFPRDSNEDKSFEIKEVVNRDKKIQLNLLALWGYQK